MLGHKIQSLLNANQGRRKIKPTKFILIGLMATGSTITAFAEIETSEQDGSRNEEHKSKMIERFDKDGDGTLFEEELAREKEEENAPLK